MKIYNLRASGNYGQTSECSGSNLQKLSIRLAVHYWGKLGTGQRKEAPAIREILVYMAGIGSKKAEKKGKFSES